MPEVSSLVIYIYEYMLESYFVIVSIQMSDLILEFEIS